MSDDSHNNANSILMKSFEENTMNVPKICLLPQTSFSEKESPIIIPTNYKYSHRDSGTFDSLSMGSKVNITCQIKTVHNWFKHLPGSDQARLMATLIPSVHFDYMYLIASLAEGQVKYIKEEVVDYDKLEDEANDLDVLTSLSEDPSTLAVNVLSRLPLLHPVEDHTISETHIDPTERLEQKTTSTGVHQTYGKMLTQIFSQEYTDVEEMLAVKQLATLTAHHPNLQQQIQLKLTELAKERTLLDGAKDGSYEFQVGGSGKKPRRPGALSPLCGAGVGSGGHISQTQSFSLLAPPFLGHGGSGNLTCLSASASPQSVCSYNSSGFISGAESYGGVGMIGGGSGSSTALGGGGGIGHGTGGHFHHPPGQQYPLQQFHHHHYHPHMHQHCPTGITGSNNPSNSRRPHPPLSPQSSASSSCAAGDEDNAPSGVNSGIGTGINSGGSMLLQHLAHSISDEGGQFLLFPSAPGTGTVPSPIVPSSPDYQHQHQIHSTAVSNNGNNGNDNNGGVGGGSGGSSSGGSGNTTASLQTQASIDTPTPSSASSVLLVAASAATTTTTTITSTSNSCTKQIYTTSNAAGLATANVITIFTAPSEDNFDVMSQSEDNFQHQQQYSENSPNTFSVTTLTNKSNFSSSAETSAGPTGDRNTFKEKGSGMSNVPSWLKSLRLHKYAGLFQTLTYEEMLSITDDWLDCKNVTKGARNKILVNIQKLEGRQSTLRQMEAELAASGGSGSALRACLLEIRHVLSTPIKPVPGSVSSASSVEPIVSPIGATENVNTAVGGGNGEVPLGDLPGQIIRCMSRACSQLLVGRRLDEDLYSHFSAAIDAVLENEAFTPRHKNLCRSWRLQLDMARGPPPPRWRTMGLPGLLMPTSKTASSNLNHPTQQQQQQHSCSVRPPTPMFSTTGTSSSGDHVPGSSGGSIFLQQQQNQQSAPSGTPCSSSFLSPPQQQFHSQTQQHFPSQQVGPVHYHQQQQHQINRQQLQHQVERTLSAPNQSALMEMFLHHQHLQQQQFAAAAAAAVASGNTTALNFPPHNHPCCCWPPSSTSTGQHHQSSSSNATSQVTSNPTGGNANPPSANAGSSISIGQSSSQPTQQSVSSQPTSHLVASAVITTSSSDTSPNGSQDPATAEINRNLDLLAREVTELAIRDPDSPQD